MTARRVVRLVERRGRVVRVPRADAEFLAAHGFDVAPAFDRRRYRVTPREVVGFLDGPTVRVVVRPKLPWPDLLRLFGSRSPESAGAGEAADLPADLLAALARELARRLADTAARGLVAGYSEAETDSPFLRGKLRTADHLREQAAGRQPLLFPVTEDRFGLDAPWNRVPKAVAADLLATPALPAAVRDELRAALAPFDTVPAAATEADFVSAYNDPRATHYRPLLDLCRTLRDARGGGGGFLIDLGRAFERYVEDGLTAALAGRPGWEVESQPRFPLAGAAPFPPPVLQPDLLVRRGGSPRFVLDAKWKGVKSGPTPDDLHQILAYAGVVGVRRAALVYPGGRFARHDIAAGAVTVSVVRVAVRGADGGRSFRRLARLVREQSRGGDGVKG